MPKLTPRDQSIVERVDLYLGSALDLYHWWQRDRDYGERFALSQEESSGADFGFFSAAGDLPVMGAVQETQVAADEKQPARVRDLRAFMLHYAMRLATCLEGGEWGYKQLYYKLRQGGSVGKFPSSERLDIVDLREIGAKYEWIVLQVRFCDLAPSLSSLVPEMPLGTPAAAAYVAISADFVVDQERPEPGVLGRYGWGYAFVNPPSDSLLAYGPEALGPGFAQFCFEVRESGEVLVQNAFVAHQPDKFFDVPLNPLDLGIKVANLASRGLTEPLLEPLKNALCRCPSAGFDPLSASMGLANLLSGGLVERQLGTAKRRLLQEILVAHARESRAFSRDLFQLWQRVPDWLDAHALPSWAAAVRPAWLDTGQYPFAPHYMQLEAGRMHYVDEGEGEVLLMVHGNGDWSFDYRYLIGNLARNYRCIAVDLIGFGLSDKPLDWDYLPQSHSHNLEAFIDKLGLKNVTLVLNDWGGPIGLSYAIRRTANVKRLVLIDTWMWSNNGDWFWETFGLLVGGRLGQFLIRQYNFFTKVGMPIYILDKRNKTEKLLRNYNDVADSGEERKGQWVFALQVLDSGAWLDQQFIQLDKLQHLPALIIWGMQDTGYIRKPYKRWVALLPKSKLFEVQHASHFPHLDAPDEVLPSIREFLDENPL